MAKSINKGPEQLYAVSNVPQVIDVVSYVDSP